jgi:hypothetical protein
VHTTALEIFYTSPAAQAFFFDTFLNQCMETRALNLLEPFGTEAELSHIARSKRKDGEWFAGVGQLERKIKLGRMQQR